MKTLIVALAMLLSSTSFAATADQTRAEFHRRLCVQKDYDGAGDIVKALFLSSMDARYSLQQRNEFNELGHELRQGLIEENWAYAHARTYCK